MGYEREVIAGVKEPETTIIAALARWDQRIQSALRVELDTGWDAYVLVGEAHDRDVLGHPIGLVILPHGDVPNPRGLLTDDLRAPFLAGAPGEIALERFKRVYRATRKAEPSEAWVADLATTVKNTARLDRPKARQRADDSFYAWVASVYVQKCQEDPRRVLRLTYEHIRRHGPKGTPWRGLTYGMVRDYVRTARDRGYLLKPGTQGVVACQVTDKLAGWLKAQKKGKKR